MKLYAVIMCGGRGERFWPLSRRRRPKQFITLFGGSSLTRQTSDRVRGLCPPERQLFVAPAEFAPLLRQQTRPGRSSLLLEPCGRNTAPAIGLAAAWLSSKEPDSVMLVLPADHVIEPRHEFERSVRLAARLAQDGMLVTFGIPPTRPDTGYGYVQVGDRLAGRGRLTAHRVRAFKEKPGLATARRYVRQGSFLWNSGMFVWRVDAILDAFRRFMPGYRRELDRFRAAVGTRREAAALRVLYDRAPSTSIDYAVMEKAENVAAVRATFAWDDVGSWLALERHSPKDRDGNVRRGFCYAPGSERCIILSDSGLVAAVGVAELVVVRAGDAVLVCSRDRLGDLKPLLKRLARDPRAKRFL